jgi:thiol-disulfide isomerase/thioredoxin
VVASFTADTSGQIPVQGESIAMKWSRFAGRFDRYVFMGMVGLLVLPAMASGQADVGTKAAPTTKGAASGESVRAITDEYNQQLLELDRGRLARLAKLAARQNPADAAATYEQLFRLAITGNLFRDAETAAADVVKKGSPAPTTAALAYLVKIVAESDRGAYEESLASLRQMLAKTEKGAAAGAALQTDEIVGICDAYYQRLVHGDQFGIARKAMQLALENAQAPALKEFLTGRLKRLDLVGKPAPAIRGKDLDGKAFDLADARGKVVLVDFWASWCLPSAVEVESLQQVAETYRSRGFQVVGINLDILQDGGEKLATVLPNIRRFLLDQNISWPTLINGSGAADYAQAYGVTDIPANVLIARDGTVSQIDLVRKNLEPLIAKAVGP